MMHAPIGYSNYKVSSQIMTSFNKSYQIKTLSLYKIHYILIQNLKVIIHFIL